MSGPAPWEDIEALDEYRRLPVDDRKRLASAWGSEVLAEAAAVERTKDAQLLDAMVAVDRRVAGIHKQIEQTRPREQALLDRGPLTATERAGEIGKSAAGALARTGAGLLTAYGALTAEQQRLRRGFGEAVGIPDPTLPPEGQPNAVQDFAQTLDDQIAETYRADPRFAGTATDQITQGAATLLSLFTPGAVAKAAGAPTKAAAALSAITGSSLEGASQYHAALRAGADEDTALKAWALGAGIGTTEALPLARPLRRLADKIDDASAGRFRQAIKDAALGGTLEAAQEFFQTSAGNLVAARLYEEAPDTYAGLLEDAPEAAGVGGLLGTILGALTSTPATRRRRTGDDTADTDTGADPVTIDLPEDGTTDTTTETDPDPQPDPQPEPAPEQPPEKRDAYKIFDLRTRPDDQLQQLADDARTPAEFEAVQAERTRRAARAEARAQRPEQPTTRNRHLGRPLRNIPAHPTDGYDIIEWLRDNPVRIPPAATRQQKTGADEVAQTLENVPLAYRGIFTPSATADTIDQAAQAAFNANLLPDYKPDTLLSAIDEAISSRLSIRRQQAQLATEEREARQQETRFLKANKPAEGHQALPVDDLAVGDTVEIDGTPLKVRAIDPDTFDVTLEDGARWGIQTVEAGELLYVEQVDPASKTQDEPEFLEPEEAQAVEQAQEDVDTDPAPAAQAAAPAAAQQQPAAVAPPVATGRPGQASTQAVRTGGSRIRDPEIASDDDAIGFSWTGLVQLSKALGLDVRVNKRLRNALGRANHGQRSIELKRGLNRDPDLAQEVVAHEIGHHIDKIPASKKGARLRQKLLPLKDATLVFRDQLRGKSGQRVKATDSRVAGELKRELVALSKTWRGPFSENDTYRNSSSELYADFLSAVLNAPRWTKQHAPLAYRAFFAGLEDKPKAHEAYNLIRSLTRSEQVAALAEQGLRQGFEAGRQKVADFARPEAISAKTRIIRAARATRRHLLNRYEWVARREGFLARAGEGGGDSFTSQLERNEGFAARERSLYDDDVRQRVTEPLEEAGLSQDDLAVYLFARRVLEERTRTGQWIEQNPGDAHAALTFLASELLPSDHNLHRIIQQADTGADVMQAAAVLTEKLDQAKLGDAATELLWDEQVPEDMRGLLHAFNVRGMMPNPEGVDLDSAPQILDALRARLGADAHADLEAAASEFYDILADRVRLAYQHGLISQQVWRERIEPNLGNYVPYQVVEYLRPRVSAAIKQQSGTTKAINDPLVASHLYTHALLGWVQRQRAAQITEEASRTFGVPHRVVGTATRFQTLEDHIRDNPDKGYVWRWKDGKKQLLEFDEPDIAQAVNHFEELGFVTRTIAQAGGVFSRLFTHYGPGFLAFTNPVRDTRTGIERIGYNYLRHIPGGFVTGIDYALSAVGAKPMSARVRQLVEEDILPPPDQSVGRVLTETDAVATMVGSSTGASRLLHGRHKLVERENLARKAIKFIDKPFVFIGAVSESVSKAAASQALRRKGLKDPDRIMLSRLMGIPNPGIGGLSVKQANGWALFYRVAVQGWRAERTFLTNPKTRGGYAMRMALTTVAPKLLQWGAQVGILGAALKEAGFEPGDDLEEFYNRLSAYKTEHGDVIPLFWWSKTDGVQPVWGHRRDQIGDDWNAVGFRLPNSESGRIAGTFTMTALRQGTDKLRDPETAKVWARWLLNQLPAPNPAVSVASANVQAAQGINPIDTYRGRPIIRYHDWEAGGFNRFQALMMWNVSQLTGSFWHWDTAVDTSGLSEGQKLVRKLPVIKNMLTVDNFDRSRDLALARAASERVAARAVLAMGDSDAPARILYSTANKLEQLGTANRTASEERQWALLRAWRRLLWDGGKDQNTGAEYPGYRDQFRAAVKANDRAELRRLRQSLNAASQPFHDRLQDLR